MLLLYCSIHNKMAEKKDKKIIKENHDFNFAKTLLERVH